MHREGMLTVNNMTGKEVRGIGQKRSLAMGGLGQLRNSGSTRFAKKQHVAAVLPKVPPLITDEVTSQCGKVGLSVPCNPVYKEVSTLSNRSKSRPISFAEGTKTWTGLRPDRHFFDTLIYQFFVLGKQFSSVDVIKVVGFDSALISGVNVLMIDLCSRIEMAVALHGDRNDVGVPILIEGGGRGMRVGSFHLPYLVSLQQVVAEAAKVVSLQFGLNTKSSEKQQVETQPAQETVVA